MKEIEIHMVLTVPEEITVDDINTAFIAWVEANDFTCGGSVKELENE